MELIIFYIVLNQKMCYNGLKYCKITAMEE